MFAQEASRACATLEMAVAKLQASIDFARGDVAPHIALGDAHATWADKTTGSDVVVHLQQALQAYQQALHINSTCTDAHIGAAEVHSRMGRFAVHNEALPDAMQCFALAAESYSRALQWPTKLGQFRDRCEIRYNCACMLSLCSRPDDAVSLLAHLLQIQGVAVSDLHSDPDLSNLRVLPIFQQWVQQGMQSTC